MAQDRARLRPDEVARVGGAAPEVEAPEGASVQLKRSLRGMDHAAGEAALAPDENVQMKGAEEEEGGEEETEEDDPNAAGHAAFAKLQEQFEACTTTRGSEMHFNVQKATVVSAKMKAWAASKKGKYADYGDEQDWMNEQFALLRARKADAVIANLQAACASLVAGYEH